MAKIGKLSEPPRFVDDETAEKKRTDHKAQVPPPPPPPLDDEDYDDGDIATPKRDRYGPDDEPF